MRIFLTLLGAALAVFMTGCATMTESSLPIDRSFTAKSQEGRVQFLVLHYTWGDFPASLKILTGGPVSSHYLVRDNPPEIYQLVDENRRSYHAGVSSWQGVTALNGVSIGIEIVNPGGRPDADGIVRFADYEPAQMEAVIKLVQDIVKRHDIRPDRVIGHSDIAPTRKVDPGPKFPWKRLADLGLVVWPNAVSVAERKAAHEKSLPDVLWFQQRLAKHGFLVTQDGKMDGLTKAVLVAFQMKYRPSNYDGSPDAETAAMLDVLTSPAKLK
jgi:N-acetylmuramoyl-L-alanine amidase